MQKYPKSEPLENLLLKAFVFHQSLTRKSPSCLSYLKNKDGKVLAEKKLQNLRLLKDGIKRMGLMKSTYSRLEKLKKGNRFKKIPYYQSQGYLPFPFLNTRSTCTDTRCSPTRGHHCRPYPPRRGGVGYSGVLSSDALGCDYL